MTTDNVAVEEQHVSSHERAAETPDIVVDDGTGTRDFLFGTIIMCGMAIFAVVFGIILSLT